MARKSIPSDAKSHHGFSADEFQRQLLNWFQDRGLLSELQAHLRHQMIVALRDTSLNINSAGSFHQAGSPKLQAINLLVAEFLLRQECHYTLSVFTSEVPLLRNLPEFTNAVQNGSTCSTSGTDDRFPGFHERDVFDILEALGFSPNCDESKKINELYEHSHGESLLTCVIRSLPNKYRGSEKPPLIVSERCESPEPQNNEEEKVLLHTPLFSDEIQALILELGIGTQQISQLYNALERIIQDEVEKVQKEEESKYHKMLIEREKHIQQLLKQHDEKIQEKLVRAGEKLKDKQTKLSKELNQKQAHLAVLASQLKEQQNEVSNRLNYVQERSDLLEQKEVELKVLKKESEEYLLQEQRKLDEKEKQIEQQLIRLDAETQAREQERRELEANRIQIEQASRAIKESQSEITLLRDLQRQHNLLMKAAEEKNGSKEKYCDHSRNKVLQLSSQAIQVDLSRQKGAVPRKHNVHQQTLRIPCEDQSLQTQISGTDMEDVFLNLRAQSTENERRRSQHEMMNNLIDHLEQENSELRGHVAQQRHRIQELTLQSSQLMQHLNEVNSSLNQIRNQPANRETDQGVQTSPLVPTPPPVAVPIRNPAPPPGAYSYQSPSPAVAPVIAPPPPPAPTSTMRTPTRGFMRSNQLGAGEESYFSRRLPPDAYMSLHSSHREHRRKPLRRLMVHSFSSSEESSPSPTEEMLSEARRRLRRLEEETAAVDRSYQEFRLRQSDSLTNTASILFPVSNDYNANSGSQNTSAGPVGQNPSMSRISSRSMLLRPQVALVNQFPSTSILQPTTALCSSRINGQRSAFNNLFPHQNNMSMRRLSTDRIPNSWGVASASINQASVPSSKVASKLPISMRDCRNAMHLPAAFNFNEQSRRRTGESDSLSSSQKCSNVPRQQQELPPCIVSAPHIPTVVDGTGFHEGDSQVLDTHKAHLINGGGTSSPRSLHQKVQPAQSTKADTSLEFEVIKEVSTKRSSHGNVHHPSYPNLEMYSKNTLELRPTREKSPEQEDSNRENNHNTLSSGLTKDDLQIRNSKKREKRDPSLEEDVAIEVNILETVDVEQPTEESIESLNGENVPVTNELNKQKVLDNNSFSPTNHSRNDFQQVGALEGEGNNSEKSQIATSSEKYVPDSREIPVASIHTDSVQDKVMFVNESENLKNSNGEKVIVDHEKNDLDTREPEIPESENKSHVSEKKSDVLITPNDKPKDKQIKTEGSLLNDSLKELSKSLSSASVLGSSKEVSSDVISAGSAGEEKSEEAW